MRILCARWWSEIRVNWLVVAMFEPSFQYTTPFSWHCIHKSSHSQAQYSHFDFIGCCRTGREGANTGKCRKLLSIMDVTTCWNIITISGMPYVLSQLYADEIRAKWFAHVILFFIHDFGIFFSVPFARTSLEPHVQRIFVNHYFELESTFFYAPMNLFFLKVVNFH